MSNGEVADLDAIAAAAAHHRAQTVLDATQACGWMPIDASRFDAAGYKWLTLPRGTAFMAVGEDLQQSVTRTAPAGARAPTCTRATSGRRCGWRPTRAGSTPRRPGSRGLARKPALELLNRIGVGSVYAHDVALANRFRAGLGMEPSNSAIVSVADAGAAQRLERAGIVAALRGGGMRASWHPYNTEHDVDRALDALSG